MYLKFIKFLFLSLPFVQFVSKQRSSFGSYVVLIDLTDREGLLQYLERGGRLGSFLLFLLSDNKAFRRSTISIDVSCIFSSPLFVDEDLKAAVEALLDGDIDAASSKRADCESEL